MLCLPIPTHHFPYQNSCITPTKQLCFFIHFHLHNEITDNEQQQPKKTRKKFLFEQSLFLKKKNEFINLKMIGNSEAVAYEHTPVVFVCTVSAFILCIVENCNVHIEEKPDLAHKLLC
jgi:hypothetical protein